MNGDKSRPQEGQTPQQVAALITRKAQLDMNHRMQGLDMAGLHVGLGFVFGFAAALAIFAVGGAW